MARSHAGAAVLLAVVALLRSSPQRASADPPPPTTAVTVTVCEGTADVRPQGDVASEVVVRMPPIVWERVRAAVGGADDFLRFLRPGRGAYELAGPPDVAVDDASQSVRVRDVQVGAAQNLGGGRWALRVPDGLERAPDDATTDGTGVVRLQTPAVAGARDPLATVEQRWRFSLGRDVADVAFDRATSTIAWRRTVPAPVGRADVAARVRARELLLATAYKVYADPDLVVGSASTWVAKAVLTNRGPGTATDVRVRFRLGTWSEWSPWSRHPELVPGQSVVARFHPVIDAKVLGLRSATAADVRVEWAWTDATGFARTDEEAARTTILGLQELVSADHDPSGATWGPFAVSRDAAPLAAAWVSQNDPVVLELASTANGAAGGVSARSNRENALRVLRECYDVLRRNDVRYLVSPSLVYAPARGERRHAQRVRFPRDTIRDRAGTCVDLAVLYAALALATGLDAGLYWVPQHCFPWVRLPDGSRVGVEVTGVAGGLDFGSRDFDWALARGSDELEAWRGDGRYVDVDVKSLWAAGVSCPDLPDLPPDVLARWGWSAAGRGRPLTPVAEDDPLVGTWVGDVAMPGAPAPWRATVDVEAPSRLGFEARVRLVGRPTATAAPAEIVATYRGERTRDGYALRTDARTQRPEAGGDGVPLGPAELVCAIEDGRVRARLGRDDEGWTELDLARAPRADGAASGAEEPLSAVRDLVPGRSSTPAGFHFPPGGGPLATQLREPVEHALRGLRVAAGDGAAAEATVDSTVWQHESDGVPVLLVAVDAAGADAGFAARIDEYAATVGGRAVRVGAPGCWMLVVARAAEARDRALRGWASFARGAIGRRRATVRSSAAGGDAALDEVFREAVRDVVVGTALATEAPRERVEGFFVRRPGRAAGTAVFSWTATEEGLLVTERWRYDGTVIDVRERLGPRYRAVEGSTTTRTEPGDVTTVERFAVEPDGRVVRTAERGGSAGAARPVVAPGPFVVSIASVAELARRLPPGVAEVEVGSMDASSDADDPFSRVRIAPDGVRRVRVGDAAASARVVVAEDARRGTLLRLAFDPETGAWLGVRSRDEGVALDPIAFATSSEPRSADEAAAAVAFAWLTGDAATIERRTDWDAASRRAPRTGDDGTTASPEALRARTLADVRALAAPRDALAEVLSHWLARTSSPEDDGAIRTTWPFASGRLVVVVARIADAWRCVGISR